MLDSYFAIILSTLLVSLISLIGVLALSIKKKFLDNALLFLVAFAAGSMLGAAFFEILPESMDVLGQNALTFTLVGILVFFVIERYIHWHHCHREHSHGLIAESIRPLPFLNLIGDGLHNMLDGAIIAASYLTDFQLGIISTVAIALHEIPQEFGDFGILIHGGLKVKQALSYNLISALLAVMGAISEIVFASNFQSITPIILGIAGGGFIYLSLVDIIPELHKETKTGKIVSQGIALLLGLLVIFSLNLIVPD